VLGQDFVLFRDERGRHACSTATARIAAPISPTVAWKMAACAACSMAGCFDVDGKCLEKRLPSPKAACVASGCVNGRIPSSSRTASSLRLSG